jgi:hypothetical protein
MARTVVWPGAMYERQHARDAPARLLAMDLPGLALQVSWRRPFFPKPVLAHCTCRGAVAAAGRGGLLMAVGEAMRPPIPVARVCLSRYRGGMP